MELLTLLFRLPFLPIQGLIRLAEIVRDEAEQEYSSPSAARRELEQMQEAYESGQASEEDVASAEYDALGRLTQTPGAAPAQVGASGEEE